MDKEKKAQEIFENYHFGDDVMVVDFDSWDKDPLENDWIRVVYVQYADKLDQDSDKISFHVKWKSSDENDLTVQEAYALEIKHGQEVGYIDEKYIVS